MIIDSHSLVLEANQQITALMTLSGQIDTEALEAMTGAELYCLLKPVQERLSKALQALEQPTRTNP